MYIYIYVCVYIYIRIGSRVYMGFTQGSGFMVYVVRVYTGNETVRHVCARDACRWDLIFDSAIPCAVIDGVHSSGNHV